MLIKNKNKISFVNQEHLNEIKKVLTDVPVTNSDDPAQIILWFKKLNSYIKNFTPKETKTHSIIQVQEAFFHLNLIAPKLIDFNVYLNLPNLDKILISTKAYEIIGELKLQDLAQQLKQEMIKPVKLHVNNILQNMGRGGKVPAQDFLLMVPPKNSEIIKLPKSDYIYNTSVTHYKSLPGVGINYIELRKSNLLVKADFLDAKTGSGFNYITKKNQEIYETFDNKYYRKLKPGYVPDNWHEYCVSYNKSFSDLIFNGKGKDNITEEFIEKARHQAAISNVNTEIDILNVNKQEIDIQNWKIKNFDATELKISKTNPVFMKIVINEILQKFKKQF